MIRPPLAERMRPQKLEDLLGQQSLLGSGGALSGSLRSGRLQSMILWGPPGCGKTTLARLLARNTQQPFHALSAVEAGVKEVRAVLDQGRGLFKPVLFLDEIHRFNKAQQDTLLQAIEQGQATLIGATTENPSFSLNAALLSRCQLLILQPLSDADLGRLAQHALESDSYLRGYPWELEDLPALVRHAQGDARRLLNTLELCCEHLIARHEQGVASPTDAPDRSSWRLDRDLIQKVLPHRLVYHDRDGDQHYQLISALIKSVRGSDPNASLYYLARLIQGGEDPVFIARRLLILASEDIGLANSHALILAQAGMQATAQLGYPEARLTLAQVTLALALSPKSNSSYLAIEKALDYVRDQDHLPPVPEALRNPSSSLHRKLGYGEGYRYSHEGENHFVFQHFMPESLQGKVFYEPARNPRENAYLEWMRQHWPQYPYAPDHADGREESP